MRKVTHEMRALLQNERGASMIEYALILAFIFMLCVPLITLAGANLNYPFQDATAGFGN